MKSIYFIEKIVYIWNGRKVLPNRKENYIMDKYECTVCGYIYDPAEGDADGGIEPGTAFDALPEDWVCPLCGAGKEDFEKVA